MSHREDLENTGRKILNQIRTELYLSMHFMGPALGSLQYIMDLSTTDIGTDGAFLRFNPHYLMRQYIERPRYLNRVYMHSLMHCIFRHMFTAKEHEDIELWDLACDIAAESVVDSMDYPAIQETLTDRRAAIYQNLTEHVKVLTAEKLYQYFVELDMDYNEQVRLQTEFYRDDHSFWLRLQDEEKETDAQQDSTVPPLSQQGGVSQHPKDPDAATKDNPNAIPPRQLLSLGELTEKDKEWQKNAKKIRTELAMSGKKASDETGSLERLLSFQLQKHTNYKEFLSRFRILREEPKIDLDSFDYGFYNYGMAVYGNMPLIEENEYREANRIEQLVIAIDTSASCQETLVQKFLNETATILLGPDTFFTKCEIHIVECDDRVQNDIVIRHPEDMRKYADGFSLKGGYGTDFRPVFRYVEELRQSGVLRHLKGLLYFTDGFGTYPKKPTDYDTAFVFWKEEELGDDAVPDWALKLYI